MKKLTLILGVCVLAFAFCMPAMAAAAKDDGVKVEAKAHKAGCDCKGCAAKAEVEKAAKCGCKGACECEGCKAGKVCTCKAEKAVKEGKEEGKKAADEGKKAIEEIKVK